VLNEEGEVNEDDPLRGDPRAVRRRFMEALEQAPDDLPLMIFIDINAPLDPDAEGRQKQWIEDIRRWMERLPQGSEEEPERFNVFVVTNFSPHYQGDDLATEGEWVLVRTLHSRNPLQFDLTEMLQGALDNYHRVPDIGEDGEILD
jgi:hypothetical protein